MTTIDELLNPKTPFEGELLLQHLKNPFFFLVPEFYEGEKAKLAEAALYVSKELYLYLFEYFKRNYESAIYKAKNPKRYINLESFFLHSIKEKGFPSKTPEQLKLEVEGLSYNNKLLQFFKEYFFPGVLDSTGIVFDEYFYSNLLQKFSSKESGKNYELVSLFRRMYAIKMPQGLYEFLLNTGSFNPPSNKKDILVPIISTKHFYTDSDYNIILVYGLTSGNPLFLANLGFYIHEDTIVVNQIQGKKFDGVVYEEHTRAMKNIKWSKVLLGTMVNIAEEFKLKLKVISAQNHILTKIPGHLSYRRAGMIYNATAKALGFKKDVDGNYILSF